MQTREPVKVPMQIRVTESQMAQDSALTNRIGTLFYLWGTPIAMDQTKLAAAGLQTTELMTSSGNCWREQWTDGPLLSAMLDPGQAEMLGPQPLAVLVEGVFPDTFEGRDPPEWPSAAPDTAATDPLADGPDPSAAPVDPQPGSLFLIGSAKMFDDNIIAASQNALLLLNAVDYLAGSHELLEIRAKSLTQRVIRPVEANEKLMWRIFVVLLVPAALAVFGIVRAGIRRRDAAAYRNRIKRSGAQT
jgi:ABC-type uncharacterized transport system involved in gliding motility auxiliary subunit